MFESRISDGAKEKLFIRASVQKQYLLGLVTWKSMQKNVWKDIANFRKTTQQLYTVAPPCMDDHQFKEEENESVGELSTVCSHMVLKCLYLARTDRPDILWSVNKLALAVTKLTKLVINAWRVWSRTFKCTVTRRFHRVYLSRRKRKRIRVNSESWFDSRRSQSQNRQTCCVLHCCESDG